MKRLMDYLPELYQSSGEVRSFQEAWQPEIEMVWQARDELLTQLDPNTATWGLRYWEDALGLAVDDSIPYDLRRRRVIARLRGMGTTTVERLQTVLETFCPGCDISIVEHFGEYLVEIRLVITDCGMDDPDGLKAMLRLIMPAHLGWGFAIRLESSGGITCGACSELAGRMDIWPLVPREIEVMGGVRWGACATVEHSAKVFPMAARSIRTTGGAAGSGALVCQGMIEIFPMEE